MALGTTVPMSTTPPQTVGLMSPCLMPKESNQSEGSDASISQISSKGKHISGSGIGDLTSQPLHTPTTMLTISSLPPIPSSSSAPSDDEMEQKGQKSNLFFSSFLPIQHLRLQAQEHLEQASNNLEQSLINKQNSFDSTSTALPLLPPMQNLESSTNQMTAYQQS